MAATSNRQILTDVCRQIGNAALAARGFRRTGTTFRRQMQPGYVHILWFQLGPSWSSCSGRFTVEVCVYIQEAFELFHRVKPPLCPTAIHCELRQRLGELDDPARDCWWPLTKAPSELAIHVGTMIETLALPFLDQVADRRSLVEAWRMRGSMSLGLPPRGDLLAAMLLHQLGQHDEANEILDAEVAESKGKITEPFTVRVANQIRAETRTLA